MKRQKSSTQRFSVACPWAPLSGAALLLLLVPLGCHAGDPGAPGATGSAGSPGSGGSVPSGSGGSVMGSDGGPASSDAGQPATTGRYIPLAIGASWTWNGFDTLSGQSGVTDSKVEAMETLTGAKAGIKAFRVRNKTLTGFTVNWQQDIGTAVVRHREQFLDPTGAVTSDHTFMPTKLRLDESPTHTALNASWTETYTDMAMFATAIMVTWKVEAVNEMVTVPAGTFSCLRVHSVQTGGAAYDSTFWFARNVGKVKESGTEERQLVRYNIP
jgi:hypothetical protein